MHRHLSIRPLILHFLLVGGMGLLVCHGAEQPEGIQMESASDLMESWLRMFGALVTVLSIFFMGVYLFKKYGTVLQNKASKGHLRVLESRALNQKNAVYVLDYQGQQFLVTTGQQGTPGITPLSIPSVEEKDLPPSSSLADKGDFRGEIRKALHAGT